MAFAEVAPLNKYLKELRRELKRQRVAAADDAIGDASEFLHGELQRLGTRVRHYRDAQLYDRFVENYWSPSDIAVAYFDTPCTDGRYLTLGPVRWTGLSRIAVSVVLFVSMVATRETAENLSPERARAIVGEFRTVLRERWSYYSFSAERVEQAIGSLAKRVHEFSTAPALALELQKIVALGIDGHAEVRGWTLGGGFLPFLIEPSGDRYVAFNSSRDRFVADEFPFIVSIDGRSIAEWLRIAESLVPKGSPGFVRRHALRQLRNIEYWRGELGLPPGAELHVNLESQDGTRTKTVAVPIGDRQQQYGVWPQLPSRMLPENVGYLRLESMDDDAVAEITEMMPRFRDTAGLVVDVRDNGGGSREPLRWLYSYLSPENGPPRVANCARYRVFSGFGDDHLTSRFLYPADSSVWNENERTAIAEFQKSFRPEWQPPDDEFSQWHYMVLSRLDGPRIFHYEKPVVVLMNEKCFSATDVFLAALKGMPNVTLVGTASGGGSARAETVRLSNTSISVRLGSMVSFMRNGSLFDGRGVDPDIVVQPEPEYFIGRSDSALRSAITICSQR